MGGVRERGRGREEKMIYIFGGAVAIILVGYEINHLLGTTEVTWKPMLTAIPEVCLAAYSDNVACSFT